MHRRRRRLSRAALLALSIELLFAGNALAQAGGGSVQGVVTRRDNGGPLAGVNVTVVGAAGATQTGRDGRYVIQRAPAGRQSIEFRLLGFAPLRSAVEIRDGATVTLDAVMDLTAVRMADVIVSTASRSPERIVEAPAAIATVPQAAVTAAAPTGQAPLMLYGVPGVDLVQNGVTDFNVNARGFNSSLTRRVLVLQDGRDVAIAFLGSTEWNAMGVGFDEFSRVEMVRGPGSALYGMNAFSGVLNLTTQSAKEAPGTRISLAGGELSTKRADLRHALVFGGGRFGLKVGAGYNSTDTWARSRTRRDSSDIVAEYSGVTDSLVPKSREVRPLIGQELDATTLAAVGDRKPVTSAYGTIRFDHYGQLARSTVEGGLADSQRETFITGLGRVQVARAQRPWARAGWSTDRVNVSAWYTGRDTREPQWALGSGTSFLEKSGIVHGEVQVHSPFENERARWIVGASARNTSMNTRESLMLAADDHRTDQVYSAYGQLDLRLPQNFRLVTAARLDDGSLFDPQFSPKAALVFSPSTNQSIRVSVNRAFQTPNYSEFFLAANAGAPTGSPRALETALEGFLATGRQIGTTGLPSDLPWNFDAQTRVLARGNRSLAVEKVTGYELGYKGALTGRGYVTVDVFWNDKHDFVTDLLPNVNPAFRQFRYDTAGTNVPAYLDAIAARAAALPAGAIPETQRQQIIGGAQVLRRNYDALVLATQPLLTTVDGVRALVVSYANAGRVTERGAEVGASLQVTDVLRAEGTYAYFDFSVKEASLGNDALLPNTPKHKGTAGLTLETVRGVDVGLTARFTSGFPWAAGVFSGYVPAAQIVNANAGVKVTPNIRVFAVASNLFDQRHFELFGGSVNGRRILGGVASTF